VDDMTKALAKLAENGGAAVGDPQPVGEMGIAAYFKDSEGNLMGLWQSTGPSQPGPYRRPTRSCPPTWAGHDRAMASLPEPLVIRTESSVDHVAIRRVV